MSETEDKARGFTVTDRRGQPDAERQPSKDPAAAGPSEAGESRPLPQIDFSTFILSLASSALMHLGELPSPDGAAYAPELPLAKQTIDILGLLADKTRGNLTSDEDKLLTHLVYDLRLKYVDARKRHGG